MDIPNWCSAKWVSGLRQTLKKYRMKKNHQSESRYTQSVGRGYYCNWNEYQKMIRNTWHTYLQNFRPVCWKHHRGWWMPCLVSLHNTFRSLSSQCTVVMKPSFTLTLSVLRLDTAAQTSLWNRLFRKSLSSQHSPSRNNAKQSFPSKKVFRIYVR